MSALTTRGGLALAALIAAVGSGCEPTPLATGLPATTQVNCSACHGSADNPAPPTGVNGESATSDLVVGAHQQHLRAGTVRNPIACGECHLVPGVVDLPDHLDAAPAEVVFGALARHQDQAPSWNRELAMCRSVYCHGGSLAGGQNTQPIWTQVGPAQRSCASCHGFPPPPPHPQLANCSYCHPGTVRSDGSIDLASGLHIDGKLDALTACNACHGSEANPAPPVDLTGNTATTAIGVGAHQAHLQAGAYRQPIECGECHLVPAAVIARGHLDGVGPAEVRFASDSLARADGATPTWQREGATPNCAGVYCHGATLGGGSTTEPVWTTVDGSQVGCETCHGYPPPPPHPALTDCAQCHQQTLAGTRLIDIAGGKHIDGQVEVAQACNGCHGSAFNPAPPVDLSGASATALHTVGAHQVHLRDGALRRAIACSECHLVPTSVDAPGHIDSSPADLTFGALATADGASPTYDHLAQPPTCSSVYCHGATLDAGGVHTRPIWTQVDGTQVNCDGCHGFPPPAPHPDNTTCAQCHPRTVTSGQTIDVASGHHIDGIVTLF